MDRAKLSAIARKTRRVNPGKIYREIDWPLLVMFGGLFVVIAGFEKAVLTPETAASIGRLHLDNTLALAGMTAVLANLISNVPAVLGSSRLCPIFPIRSRPAGDCDDIDIGGEFYFGWIGRQLDRCPPRLKSRHRD